MHFARAESRVEPPLAITCESFDVSAVRMLNWIILVAFSNSYVIEGSCVTPISIGGSCVTPISRLNLERLGPRDDHICDRLR